MASSVLPVVMAGGSGTRLWPLSRTHFPKQFLSLASDNTLFQDTLLRVGGEPYYPPLIVCNEEHRFLVAEQLRKKTFPHSGIILEPMAKNTAPAIALAALKAIQDYDDPVLLVLAADHYIDDMYAFRNAVQQALPLAEKGKMVTFGICPTAPETGYGYIKSGEQVDNAFLVTSFVEKPARDKAEAYLAAGGYYWNSGIFMFKARQYLAELGHYCPEVLTACEQSMSNCQQDLDFIRIDTSAFVSSPDISVDFAVMEHTTNAVMMPLAAQWNDVGSWTALWDIGAKDVNGNVVRGDVMLADSANCYINAGSRLVATVGLNDIIVVDTGDALLVANKQHVQQVKEIVNHLKVQQRSEAVMHKEVFRPWGYYETLSAGEKYQVKKVYLKPGEKISAQIHHHRAEHWIVVAGVGKVVKDDVVFLIQENESTYIPAGVVHSLENPGDIPLELIEIHSGSYISEDDIVRLDRHYPWKGQE